MADNCTIYYLSGTGNALTAARWIKEEGGKKGYSTELIPIDRFDSHPFPLTTDASIVGFLYPTHGFSLPWYMLKFMLRYPRRRNMPVFMLNTFAGTKVWRWFVPGLSGLALILPALVMLAKGFRVRALFSLKLPSNWIALHPGFNDAASGAIHEKCRVIIADFCGRIFAGKRDYRGLRSLPFDLAISPISVGYNLIGRFWLGKMFMPSQRCNGCGICEQKCPVGAIRMVMNRPYWTWRCESCMRCINICPTKGVEISHVFLVLALYGIYGLFYDHVGALARWSGIDQLAYLAGTTRGAEIGKDVFGLILLFCCYPVAHLLARREPFHFLFFMTSPTHYWRRYLSRGIKAKDFGKGPDVGV